ncbi:MAG: CHAT domain-containing protein, partial [Gammaproteobacteria bacterium]
LGQDLDANGLLDVLAQGLESVGAEYPEPHLWLGVGKLSLQLAKKGIEIEANLQRAYTSLANGDQRARDTDDRRTQSLAHGYLGELYESQERYGEALTLTDEAIRLAQGMDARDLLLEWEWQSGRIYKLMGDDTRALQAFRRAVVHVEVIRQDIPVDYRGGRSSFRETLEPLYLGLAELLLEQATSLSPENKQEQQALLRETRQTVELIKRTELEDYFNNRCIVESVADFDLVNIDDGTASIYPVIFEDHLSILISVGGSIHHRTVDVPSFEVEITARALATSLRYYTSDFQEPSQQLYQWLIDPIADLLEEQNVDTLIFIPDGVLRLVPLAALADGGRYVIRDYAVVNSPGLSLFEPDPVSRENVQVLAAGLSEPGAVVTDLPDSVLGALIAANDDASRGLGRELDPALGRNRSIAGLSTLGQGEAAVVRGASNTSAASRLAENLDADTIASLQSQLALPGVTTEIEMISDIFRSSVLLNETFVRQRLVDEMLEQPFQMVHIASHGVFGRTADESFVMTHDRILSMNDLEALLYSEKFKDYPVELMILSACQTAEGDDRAPLGISGIALRARVRSALGSLWSISDAGTVEFMRHFYTKLNRPELSKARALQEAQLELLDSDDYAHPFFWSPFILIGNWL